MAACMVFSTLKCIIQFKYRKKHENMLMVGVWFGQNKPVMSTFLEPIVELLKFETKGKYVKLIYMI